MAYPCCTIDKTLVKFFRESCRSVVPEAVARTDGPYMPPNTADSANTPKTSRAPRLSPFIPPSLSAVQYSTLYFTDLTPLRRSSMMQRRASLLRTDVRATCLSVRRSEADLGFVSTHS